MVRINSSIGQKENDNRLYLEALGEDTFLLQTPNLTSQQVARVVIPMDAEIAGLQPRRVPPRYYRRARKDRQAQAVGAHMNSA